MTRYDVEAMGIIAAVLGVITLLTVVSTRLIGRRMSARHPRAAVLVTGLTAAAIFQAAGWTTFLIDTANHPGSDWPAMQMVGTMIYTGLAVPVGLAVAKLDLRGRGPLVRS